MQIIKKAIAVIVVNQANYDISSPIFQHTTTHTEMDQNPTLKTHTPAKTGHHTCMPLTCKECADGLNYLYIS